MTEVHIEQASLSEGSVLVFKDYGANVRLAYDPSRITEAQALAALSAYVPKTASASQRNIHRIAA